MTSGRCVESQHPSYEEAQSLFAQIISGNREAFLAGIHYRQCFDGAVLEDFYRASGVFLRVQPRAFLDLISPLQLSVQELTDFATMLPLSTVDVVDLKIEEIDARLAALSRVRKYGRQRLNSTLVSILRTERQDILSQGSRTKN